MFSKIINHESASHTPKPAKNEPKDIKEPVYTTVGTPSLGRRSGVCRTARQNWTKATSGNVTRSGVLVFAASPWIAPNWECDTAMVERMYACESKRHTPRDRRIELTRCRQEMKTGMR